MYKVNTRLSTLNPVEESVEKLSEMKISDKTVLDRGYSLVRVADPSPQFKPEKPLKNKQPKIPKEKVVLVPSPERTKTGKMIKIDKRELDFMSDSDKKRFDANLERVRQKQKDSRRKFKRSAELSYVPQSGTNQQRIRHDRYGESWTDNVVFANFTEEERIRMNDSDVPVFIEYGCYGPNRVWYEHQISRGIELFPQKDICRKVYTFTDAEIEELRNYGVVMGPNGKCPKFHSYSTIYNIPKDHPLHIDNRKLQYCYPAPAQNALLERDMTPDHFTFLADHWEPQAGKDCWEPQVGLFQMGLDEESRTMLEGLARTVSDVSERMENVTLKVAPDQDMMSMVGDFSMVLLIIAILCVVRPSTRNERVAMSMMVAGFLISRGGLNTILENIGIFDWFKKPQPAGYVPESGGIEEVATLITGLLSTYLCLKTGSDIFDSKELIRVVGACGRMKMGIRSITDALTLVTNYVYASLDHWFTGKPYFVSCGHGFIDAFLTEAKEIVHLAESKELHNLQSSVDRTTKCIELGESIAMKVPATADLVGLRMQIMNILGELRKIRKNLLGSNFKFSGIRVEPTGVLLRGAPGVGKSQALQHLAHAVNAMTLDDKEFELYRENPGSHVWNRQAENKFWDGYSSNMNVCIYDDIGQATDMRGEPDNEFMGAIRNINVFAHNLHCAAIESKSNTNFRSNFVLATTNLVSFSGIQSINQIDAFLRRWNPVVDVVPKDKYCLNPTAALRDRRFDPLKLPIFSEKDHDAHMHPNLIGTSRVHPSMCDYYVQRMTSDNMGFEFTGEVIEYEELVRRIYRVHMTKVMYHKMYLKELDDTLFLFRKEKEVIDMIEPQIGDNDPPAQTLHTMNSLVEDELTALANDAQVTIYITPENLRRFADHYGDDWNSQMYAKSLCAATTIRGLAHGYYWPHSEIIDFIIDLDIKVNLPQGMIGSGTFEDDMERVFMGMATRPQSEFAASYVRTYARIEKAKDLIKNYKALVPKGVELLGRMMNYTFSYSLYMANGLLDAGVGGANNMLRLFQGSSTLKSTVLGLIASIPIILTAVKAIGAISSLFSSSEPESDERHGRLRRARVVRRPQGGNEPILTSRNSRFPNGFNPQSISRHNENLSSIMRMLMVQNTFEVWIPVSDEPLKSPKMRNLGFAIGLKGRSLLLPFHFVSVVSHELHEGSLKADHVICLYRPGKRQYTEFSLTAKEFMESFKEYAPAEKQDLAMVKLPKRFNPVRDVTHLFATSKQLDMYKKVDAVLLVPATDAKEYHPVKATRGVNAHVESDSFHPYVVKDIFSYDAFTTAGDCGSLLLVNDKSKHSCLIGMHVAGSVQTTKGFSSVVSKELIEEYLKFIGEDYVEVDALQIDIPLLEPRTDPRNMINVGEFAPEVKHPPQYGKSKIIRSPLYGLIAPVTKAPARLAPFTNSEGVRIDPMEIALSGYCEADIWIDPIKVSSARSALFDMIASTSSKNVERVVYTFDHAVLGDDEGDFSSVPRNTSAGFPYNVMSGKSTKARFFGEDPVYDLNNEEALQLRYDTETLIVNARKGIRMMSLYSDHLKDERRSLAKVEAGATRLISACPTASLIAFRQLFGAFGKCIIRNRIDNGMLIGINEYSEEWNQLAVNLQRFGDGPNKGAGDYKGFDMKHKNQVAWAILQGINEWYTAAGDCAADNLAREVLWLDIVNSRHVNGDRLFEWKTPLPSGAPVTALFNCLANHMYFRICWQMLTETSAYQFNKFVYLAVLGDDNAWSIDHEWLPLFNERKLQVAMKEIGQVYTPEDKTKTEFTEEMRTLEGITILKRSFRRHELTGKWVAPLDLDTILDLVNWTKTGPSYLGDTENNVKIALEELTLHGKEVFTKWKNVLLKAIEQCEGINKPSITDYYELFREVQSRDRGANVEVRFFTDYDVLRYKTPIHQTEDERLEEERAGLSRLTSRIARWQPQSNPGKSGIPHRLVRREVYESTATSAVGLTNEGTFETQRAAELPAQNSDITSDNVDAETPVTQIVKFVPLNSQLLDSARTGAISDIKAFLARPVTVKTGTLAVTDSYATFKWQSVIPQALLANNLIWKKKVEGFLAFRGTLHLTVSVNGTRMQQGRYMLTWCPTGGGANYDKWFRMHAASIAQATQLPHVEIDINCDTEATLIIPQITAQGWSMLDFSGLTTYNGNNGIVFFTAYHPLEVSTGSSTANYFISAHWEDVELSSPVVPQSNVGRVKSRVKRRVPPAETEALSQGMGPISDILHRVSTSAGILAGVPFLNSIAAPVSWATEIMAKAAHSFGWSKPHNSEHATIFAGSIAHRCMNADVADNSTKLAVFDSNSIEELPGFAGSDLDELSLNYVASISSFYTGPTWSTGQAYGTLLTYMELSPRNFAVGTGLNGHSLLHMAPVSFVTNFFALYRGSLKFTFKIVKTEFHTGRLALVFTPKEYASHNIPLPVLADSSYLHKEVIDIREGNEFCFIAPYTSPTPYRSTAGLDAGYGTLSLYVLNPLVAPDSVPSTVRILCEVSAGPDMEWAQPREFSGSPIQTFVPQAGNVCEITEGVVGNASIYQDQVAARLCIGERILSFRSLLRRFNRLIPSSVPVLQKHITFSPWCSEVGHLDVATPLQWFTNTADTYAILQTVYALGRGGMRYKVISKEAAPSVLLAATTFAEFNSPIARDVTFAAAASSSRVMAPSALFRPLLNGGVEIEVPYYNRTHSHPSCDLIGAVPGANAIVPTFNSAVPRTTVVVTADAAFTIEPVILRATSEDHSFGLFCSIPPILGWNA